jgi:hypothetical protein
MTLSAVGANKELIHNLNELRLYLETLSSEELGKIFSPRPEVKQRSSPANVPVSKSKLDFSTLSRMELNEIKPLIDDPETDKDTLRKIAVARFGEPRGSAAKYSRNELRVRISGYISNESGHASIKRLAKPAKDSE